MANYHGDIHLGDTIDIQFSTTSPTTGVCTQLAGSPVISAYIGNSTTQITAGITLTADLDGVTGLNNVRVVASGGNGYGAATNVSLVITTGTVGGASAVGYAVGSFSIDCRGVNQILGTAVSTPATAGILDVNVKNINNVAAATPGAAGGLFIAGTNAATAVTTSFSINGTPMVSQTGDSFARIGSAGVGLTNLGDTRVANLDAAVSTRMATFTLPTNFSSFSIDASGRIDLAKIKGTASAGTAGYMAPDWAQVLNPTSTVALTNTTVGVVTLTTTVTNLTNAPTAGDFTATMKASLNAATPVVTVSGDFSATMKTSIGTAVAASAVASVTAGVTVTTNNDKTGYALSATGSAALTESYAADGAAATLPQLLYMTLAMLSEFSITGTTLTAKKLDGSTTAGTFTLSDATNPTSITRAT